MILINLLPPELRRARRSGVNPIVLATAAGVVIVLGLASIWAWVEFGRIRAAEARLTQLEADLVAATAAADKVRAVDKQIADFEKLHATITKLITRKVFWARTIDDFANLIAQTGENRWTIEGYEVRCTSLAITPKAAPAAGRGARNAGESVAFSFRASFRIVGERRDQAGDYVRSFFQTVDLSRFWRDNGFTGRSEEPFKGDSPQFKENIGRVVTDLPLEWTRVKMLSVAQGDKK
ncbi:MAG TPA: hypothetical protein DCS97_14640 [Planctomycetes bacterium]|nr:hypothetical protein [Planctomycetota bacterium]